MKGTGFKVNILIRNLSLQKLYQNPQSKNNLLALERWLELWQMVELAKLFLEKETTQAWMKTLTKPHINEKHLRRFKSQMSKGSINAALSFLAIV